MLTWGNLNWRVASHLWPGGAAGCFLKAHTYSRKCRAYIRQAATGERRSPYTQSLVVIVPLRRRRLRAKCVHCATSQACTRFETLATNERSGLEPCASSPLCRGTNIKHFCRGAQSLSGWLIVSTNPHAVAGCIAKFHGARNYRQSIFVFKGASGLRSVAGWYRTRSMVHAPNRTIDAVTEIMTVRIMTVLPFYFRPGSPGAVRPYDPDSGKTRWAGTQFL